MFADIEAKAIQILKQNWRHLFHTRHAQPRRHPRADLPIRAREATRQQRQRYKHLRSALTACFHCTLHLRSWLRVHVCAATRTRRETPKSLDAEGPAYFANVAASGRFKQLRLATLAPIADKAGWNNVVAKLRRCSRPKVIDSKNKICSLKFGKQVQRARIRRHAGEPCYASDSATTSSSSMRRGVRPDNSATEEWSSPSFSATKCISSRQSSPVVTRFRTFSKRRSQTTTLHVWLPLGGLDRLVGAFCFVEPSDTVLECSQTVSSAIRSCACLPLRHSSAALRAFQSQPQGFVSCRPIVSSPATNRDRCGNPKTCLIHPPTVCVKPNCTC